MTDLGPDPVSEAFAAECQRQSEVLRDDPNELETQEWLELAADRGGWV